jgi:hypothetical protein
MKASCKRLAVGNDRRLDVSTAQGSAHLVWSNGPFAPSNRLDRGLNVQRDGQLQLMSGQWWVTGFEPIFKVADVARSVAWFERADESMRSVLIAAPGP